MGIKRRKSLLCLLSLLVALIASCRKQTNGTQTAGANKVVPAESARLGVTHKVIHVNSYHEGSPWSDKVEMGIHKAFEGSKLNVEHRHIYMDSKRNHSDEFLREKAKTLVAEIHEWQPEVIIASDDNACKYLVANYLKDEDIPVIFCGVNWDIEPYGFPCSNITGMVEIDPVERLLKELKPFSKGGRVGYLCADVISSRKVIMNLEKHCGIKFTDGIFAQTFDEWKKAFLRLQGTTDMLIMPSHQGISDWHDREGEEWVFEHVKIPVGTMLDHVTPLALIGVVKVPEEQGYWAAQAALKILNGTSIKDIPVTHNKNSRLILNMRIARKMGIKFPIEMIQQATLVGEAESK